VCRDAVLRACALQPPVLQLAQTVRDQRADASAVAALSASLTSQNALNCAHRWSHCAAALAVGLLLQRITAIITAGSQLQLSTQWGSLFALRKREHVARPLCLDHLQRGCETLLSLVDTPLIAS
jgi:hypothetical protein